MPDSTLNREGQSSLASVTHGASIFFLGRLLSHALKFILSFLLTRGLGVSLYGIYTYGTTILSFAIILARMGGGKAVLRFVPAYEDQSSYRNRLVGLAYLTALAGSTIIGIAIFILAPTISSVTLDTPLLVDVLRILALILPFNTVIKLTNAVFRGTEQLKYQVLISDILHPIIQVGVVGIALFLGYSLLGIVSALALTAVLICIIAMTLLYNQTTIHPSICIHREQSELFEFYNFSIPLTLKDMGSLLYNRVDILMIGIFLVESSVGVYRISVLIASLVVLPLAALNQLFPPVASRLYSNTKTAELESVYETVTRWSLTVAIPPALITSLYSSEVLKIFGSEFTTGSFVLVLFVLGQLTDSAVGPSGYLLMMTGNQYLSLVNQWLFGLLNISLNYLFITKFGLIGAALATAGLLALLNIVRVTEVWYMEGLTPYSPAYWKPLFAGALTGMLMIGLSHLLDGYVLLVSGSAIGSLVFALLLVLLGIELQDREFFSNTIGKRLL